MAKLRFQELVSLEYKYQNEIFESIINVFRSQDKHVRYNELYRESISALGKDGKGFSRRSFDQHVRKLVKEKWLNKYEDENVRAKIKPISFSITKKGMISSRLKVDVIKGGQFELGYVLLLSQAAFGFSWFRPVKKFEAGLVVYKNPYNDKTELLRLSNLPGVSPSDFQKRVLNFHLHRDMDSTKVKECMKLMTAEDCNPPPIPSILKPIDKSNGELRYCIVNPILNGFIIDCWGVIDLILHRMRVVWNNLRKPSEAENTWYGMLSTERVKMFHFAESYNYRGNQKTFPLKDKNKRGLSNEEVSKIISYDNRIKEDVKRIFSKYPMIIKAVEYSFFSELLMQMTYPTFLQEFYRTHKLY